MHRHLTRLGRAVPARQCGGPSNGASRACRRAYASSPSSSSSSSNRPNKPPRQPARPNTHKPLAYKPPPAPPGGGGGSSSSSSSSSSSANNSINEAQPVSELLRTRWFALFASGAATVCIGYFVASLAIYWKREAKNVVRCEPGQEPQAPTGRPTIQSPVEFDLHLDKSEWRLGITKLRRRLGAAARGHVLEVAVGTGRNLEFYDWDGIATATAATTEEGEKDNVGVNAEAGAEAEAETTQKQGKSLIQRLEEVRYDRSKLAAALEEEEAKLVRSYTGLDISPEMLDVALRRMRQVVPGVADALPKRPRFKELASQKEDSSSSSSSSSNNGKNDDGNARVSLLGDKIRVLAYDAQFTLPPPPPPIAAASANAKGSSSNENETKYDTIIQTFGLCSVRDPTRLLASMAAALRPETGRILLLEHGRSSWWELVNGLLDRGARGHFERFGCWWNRDIEDVVRGAARSVPGLEVVRLERPGWLTFGTHIWVELRVTGTAGKEAIAAAGGKRSGDESNNKKVERPPQQQQKSGGWFGFGSLLGATKNPPEPKDS
ncbi:hypothetical protein SLS62_010406 [Diatrype stigma]|uniref:Uncharacterized protein n=1 Tax=Diatrype stigma TaxID=117547 RepID=A0AAN9YHB6_9PEZI